MKKPGWLRYRGYAHFDLPAPSAVVDVWVRNMETVAAHAFCPLLRFDQVTKRRAGTKTRTIQYASHADAAIYAWYAHVMDAPYEAALSAHHLGDNILAYRSQLRGTNVDFAEAAFEEVRSRGDCTVVCMDISGFFDNLDHTLLRAAWCRLLGMPRLPDDHFAVFRSLTRYAFVDGEALRRQLGIGRRVFTPPSSKWGNHRVRTLSAPTQLCTMTQLRAIHADSVAATKTPLIQTHTATVGIPQGTPISAFLSNLYMLEFDKTAADFAAANGGYYRRYCDDILFVVPPGQHMATEAFVVEQVRTLGLALNTTKTETVHFVSGRLAPGNRPVQYLGLTFDGTHVRIRDQSISRYRAKQTRAVKAAKKAALQRAGGQVFIRPLMRRFTHLSPRNFVRYGHRISDLTGDDAARRQVTGSIERVLADVERTR